jgi:hypothetical protein
MILELNLKSFDGKECILTGSLLSLFKGTGLLWFYNVVEWLTNTLMTTEQFSLYLELPFCVLFMRGVQNRQIIRTSSCECYCSLTCELTC